MIILQLVENFFSHAAFKSLLGGQYIVFKIDSGLILGGFGFPQIFQFELDFGDTEIDGIGISCGWMQQLKP